MSKRADKVQKRNAKKKASLKKTHRSEELHRLFVQEGKKYEAIITKSMIINELVNNRDSEYSKEDVELYFETLETELDVNFDTEFSKPIAFEMRLAEDGVMIRPYPWFRVFVSRLMDLYSESEEQAMARSGKVTAGVTACIVSSKDIVYGKTLRCD